MSKTIKRTLLIKLGEKIRKIRKDASLSQEELAHKAKLHRTYIGMIERGEKNITLTNIDKISRALGTEIKKLLDFTNGK